MVWWDSPCMTTAHWLLLSNYEDTLRLPKEQKNLFFVDSVDREGFARYFMECFQKYEDREGSRL